MPEFVLDLGSPEAAEAYNALDAFTQGYVEAMFFTETGYEENRDLEHASVDELAPVTWARIKTDCAKFQRAAALLLEQAYATGSYTEEQAGRDFWFTRNGHGVGFWDRGLGDLGDRLADMSRHRELCLYRGDSGRLYLE